MDDEVMREIRRIREELAAKFDHDLHALYRYFKQRERESGRTYVNLEKRTKTNARVSKVKLAKSK